MDSIFPTYPPFSSSSPKSNASIGQGYPGRDGQSAADQKPSEDCELARLVSAKQQPSHPNLLPQTQPHLYSPTRAEIESHPIRQRLSLGRDEIVTGYGTAQEATSETAGPGSASAELELSQAQEGSERLQDAMSSEAPAVQPGDAVSYAWGSGRPEGTVTEVETKGAVTMVTNRGNEVQKQGEPENPALYIERSGHDVVKKASEVTVDEKANDSKPAEPSKSAEPEKKPESEGKKEESPQAKPEEKKQENGEPQTGDKRPAEEPAEEKKAEEPNGEAKKQKTDDKPKENGEPTKKKGRPAKVDADGKPVAKKETKKRPPKKAATESGEPRRSGRNASKSA